MVTEWYSVDLKGKKFAEKVKEIYGKRMRGNTLKDLYLYDIEDSALMIDVIYDRIAKIMIIESKDNIPGLVSQLEEKTGFKIKTANTTFGYNL